MSSGISAEWDEYREAAIETHLEGIIQSIQRGWIDINPLQVSERENRITLKLCKKLHGDRGLRALSIKVFCQPQNPDADAETYTQIDLHFQHLVSAGFNDFVWFECKRLCCHSEGGSICMFHGAAYADGNGQGMLAFVSRRYEAPSGHAGMLAYVLCSTSARDVVESLEESIDGKRILLQLGDPPHLVECEYARGSRYVRTTKHLSGLQIHHVILVAHSASEAEASRLMSSTQKRETESVLNESARSVDGLPAPEQGLRGGRGKQGRSRRTQR